MKSSNSLSPPNLNSLSLPNLQNKMSDSNSGSIPNVRTGRDSMPLPRVGVGAGAGSKQKTDELKSKSFDLITDEIHLEMGVWIGAQAIVGPGVRCCSNSVLAAGSIAFKNLDSNCVYQGNPAEVKRMRN